MMERPLSRSRFGSWALGLLVVASQGTIPAATEESPTVGPSWTLVDPSSIFRRAAPGGRELVTIAPGMDVELGGGFEPTIAVNPTDPLNLVYSSGEDVRVSTDGGLTWQAPVPLKTPTNDVVRGDPCATFDADGRLFVSYFASELGEFLEFLGIDLLVAQLDPATGMFLPGYPVDVTTQIGLPGSAGNANDKGWIVADAHPGSPFANRLYLVWTTFPGSGDEITVTSYSADHGLTWSPALQLGASGPGFLWPSHITVAPNGYVYAADHRQPTLVGGAPDGISGFIPVFRSTNGGVSFDQETQAFPAGTADMTFNVQSLTMSRIPGATFWLQGSVQPWVLADPNVPGRIYVVANDDPDNNVRNGDPADVFIVTSTDYGATWSTPARVDHGPGTTFQVMPTAAIDPQTGTIVVHYYDNRAGTLNGSGHYLLDVYATVSTDGGATFSDDFPINDFPFDPDAGAICRYSCGPPLTDAHANGTSTFAAAISGTLLAYAAGAWSSVAATGVTTYGVWSSTPTDAFLCGANGSISHFDGSSLTGQSSGTTANLFAIDGASASDVYVAGAGGTVLHYNGTQWSSIAAPTVADLHGVWVNPTGSTFVVGSGGTVLRYDGSWSDMSIAGAPNLFHIWGTSDDELYVGSTADGLFHWDGGSWAPVETGLLSVAGVWGSSSTDVVITSVGRIQRYDGIEWIPEEFSESLLFDVTGNGATDVFAVGGDTETIHYDGLGWTKQANPLRPTAPTRRIGEYNGVAVGDGRAFTVWCGNTFRDGAPLDQQTIFDSFDLPGPGEAGSTVPLQVSRSGGNLEFAWGATSCGNVSYGLYRGDLTTLNATGYSHDVALACAEPTTGWMVSETDPALGSADYFLVVAATDFKEGSYGRDGDGLERPASAAACTPGQNLAPCGP